MAIDNNRSLTISALDAFPITPNDATDISVRTRWILVSTAGNLRVTLTTGQVVTIPVPAGVIPLRVDRVWSTGTTAAGLAGLV
jgi:hypothetical protein